MVAMVVKTLLLANVRTNGVVIAGEWLHYVTVSLSPTRVSSFHIPIKHHLDSWRVVEMKDGSRSISGLVLRLGCLYPLGFQDRSQWVVWGPLDKIELLCCPCQKPSHHDHLWMGPSSPPPPSLPSLGVSPSVTVIRLSCHGLLPSFHQKENTGPEEGRGGVLRMS